MLKLLRRGWARVDRWLDDWEPKQKPQPPQLTDDEVKQLFSRFEPNAFKSNLQPGETWNDRLRKL